MRPPSPRSFTEPQGGNKAFAAIILAVIFVAASAVYQNISAAYLSDNFNRYIDGLFEGFDIYGDMYGYDPWNQGDVWGDDWYNGDDWSDEWNGRGYGDDYGGDDWDYDDGYWDDDYYNDLTSEEQAVIDAIRESFMPGFPDFTVEEVLLSRVDDDGLYWDCFEAAEEDPEESPRFYVSAYGYIEGSFEMVFSGFEVYGDGTFEIFYLEEGATEAYEEEAIELYEEWYDDMLTGSADTTSA